MDVSAIQTQLNILTGAVGLVALIVGGAATYLKLTMKNEIFNSQQRIITEVKNEFARKDLLDAKLDAYDRRLGALETRSTVNKVVNGST